ncbi:MAG: hypothetical protein A2W74_02570 [Planctomycetes bacterium RIFCSPLOWO2_12_38_17]|nr:MAG: hypothetical protein A2W74_02570 [Planctomycetes bacterium RIFCSPLOWO2_12_38_17]
MSTLRESSIVNSFATECFRNVADKDYIVARNTFRLGLIEHFQWNAHQAIEKYFKAILLYNKKSTKGIGHDLSKALRRISTISEFSVNLSDEEDKYINHLNNNAQNRYLEQPSCSFGEDLFLLDMTVWSIRRYCHVINYKMKKIDGTDVNLLPYELKKISHECYKENPYKFRIGGYLEGVLGRKKTDLERISLTWKNSYFGARRKIIINNFPIYRHAVVPPHFRDERRYHILKDYVDFPGRIRKLFKE